MFFILITLIIDYEWVNLVHSGHYHSRPVSFPVLLVGVARFTTLITSKVLTSQVFQALVRSSLSLQISEVLFSKTIKFS